MKILKSYLNTGISGEPMADLAGGGGVWGRGGGGLKQQQTTTQQKNQKKQKQKIVTWRFGYQEVFLFRIVF